MLSRHKASYEVAHGLQILPKKYPSWDELSIVIVPENSQIHHKTLLM
jgi:hypothetical protein